MVWSRQEYGGVDFGASVVSVYVCLGLCEAYEGVLGRPALVLGEGV